MADYFLNMQAYGKMIFIAGVVLALVGLWVWSGRGFGLLGKLPGDISVQKEGFGFYFPLTTCLLLSAVVTLLAWFFKR